VLSKELFSFDLCGGHLVKVVYAERGGGKIMKKR